MIIITIVIIIVVIFYKIMCCGATLVTFRIVRFNDTFFLFYAYVRVLERKKIWSEEGLVLNDSCFNLRTTFSCGK